MLQGRLHGPQRDIVMLNSAAGLVVSEKAEDLKEGIALASQSIDGGAALAALESLKKISNS